MQFLLPPPQFYGRSPKLALTSSRRNHDLEHSIMGLKDEHGEQGFCGGTLWARGPQLDFVSEQEAASTAAHKAAKEGCVDKLAAALVASPEQLDQQDFGGNTPLHIAARTTSINTPSQINPDPAGRFECAKFLISKGAKLDVRDMHGDTPLSLAAMSEPAGSKASVGIVALLLEAGADPANQDNVYKMTPLHWAANGGKIEVLYELLADKRVKETKDVEDREGNTPLQLATAAKHNSDEAQRLLKKK